MLRKLFLLVFCLLDSLCWFEPVSFCDSESILVLACLTVSCSVSLSVLDWSSFIYFSRRICQSLIAVALCVLVGDLVIHRRCTLFVVQTRKLGVGCVVLF